MYAKVKYLFKECLWGSTKYITSLCRALIHLVLFLGQNQGIMKMFAKKGKEFMRDGKQMRIKRIIKVEVNVQYFRRNEEYVRPFECNTCLIGMYIFRSEDISSMVKSL